MDHAEGEVNPTPMRLIPLRLDQGRRAYQAADEHPCNNAMGILSLGFDVMKCRCGGNHSYSFCATQHPRPFSQATMQPSALPSDILLFERGWLSSNNVLLLGQDSTALVDSGYATHAPQTLALVGAALGGRPLCKWVLIRPSRRREPSWRSTNASVWSACVE
jgi:hypothetical protein